jgi:hypothetical protein
MEHVLQAVTGSGMMSMLDGFSGYNQVMVARKDKYRYDLHNPLGNLLLHCMPFGLMNVGATFQRAMDFIFSDYLFKFIVVYQDDIIVFSKNRDDHITHLRKF